MKIGCGENNGIESNEVVLSKETVDVDKSAQSLINNRTNDSGILNAMYIDKKEDHDCGLNDSTETLDKIEQFILDNSPKPTHQSLIRSTSNIFPDISSASKTRRSSRTTMRSYSEYLPQGKRSRSKSKSHSIDNSESKKRTVSSSQARKQSLSRAKDDNLHDKMLPGDNDPHHPTSSCILRLKGRKLSGSKKLTTTYQLPFYCKQSLTSSSIINDVVDGEVLVPNPRKLDAWFSINASVVDSSTVVDSKKHLFNSSADEKSSF